MGNDGGKDGKGWWEGFHIWKEFPRLLTSIFQKSLPDKSQKKFGQSTAKSIKSKQLAFVAEKSRMWQYLKPNWWASCKVINWQEDWIKPDLCSPLKKWEKNIQMCDAWILSLQNSHFLHLINTWWLPQKVFPFDLFIGFLIDVCNWRLSLDLFIKFRLELVFFICLCIRMFRIIYNKYSLRVLSLHKMIYVYCNLNSGGLSGINNVFKACNLS